MNAFESYIARIRIKGKNYPRNRWKEMIKLGKECEQTASDSFSARDPFDYLFWEGRANMYRKRAAWYLNKMKYEE